MTELDDIAFEQCVKHCMGTQMTKWDVCADYCETEGETPAYDDEP